MAGKFVSIEEAARLLGIGVDEVKGLVERKKLFPLLDGKFKVDEINRVAESLGDDSSRSESLALDLDLPTSGGDDLAFGDAIDVGDALATDAGSQTIVRAGAAPGGPGELSGLALGDDDALSDSADLALESIIGASSPSLGKDGSGALAGSAPGPDDPLALDLTEMATGTGSGAPPGSQATGAPGSGSGFATPLDSGLSLDDGGPSVSGVDLTDGAGVGDGSLLGDSFDLGTNTGDDDSASVVIATDDSGDSSFFTTATDDSASVAFDESTGFESGSSSGLIPSIELHTEMKFSGWQIAGLTCCAAILLAGGLIMYDVVETIRAPQGTPVTTPLLNALGQAFGWRG